MVEYSGFWIRVGAYLIDALILAFAGAVVGGIVGVVMGVGMAAGGSAESDIVASANLVGNAIGLVMGMLYFTLMESSARRGTIGKIAVGIEVSDEQGRQLSFGRALGRYFAKFVSAIIMGIGYLMVGWTERKQGLHDMIAGTLVTRKGTLNDIAGQTDVFR